MTNTSPATPAPVGGTLTRSLGLIAIVGLGLGYMTPTVVFDTFGIVSEDTSGAVPAAYLVALVVMTFTAISYGKMAGVFRNAGSAYTYVRESVHPNVGFMVGWTSLMDYLLLPMVNCLIIRLYLEQVFHQVPGWIWVVLYVAVTTTIIYVSMRSTSNVNMLLLLFSIVIMAVFVVMVIAQLVQGEGAGTLASGTPFLGHPDTGEGGSVQLLAILSGATVVCFSFIGFDAVTMYTEEAKTPRTMPRAILLTVLLGGAIFLVAAYFTQLRFPDNAPFGDYVDDPLPQIGVIVGGPVFQAVFVAAGFCATTASGLASHASVSRMMLVMGRNGVFPRRVFGYVNPRTHTPTWNIVIVGAVALFAMSFSLELIASLINFGALIAFTFVNLSVIAWFAVRERRRRTPREIFDYIVMPGIGVLLTLTLWLNLDRVALIGGGVWLAAGLLYLLWITRGFKRQPAGFDENQPVTGVNKIPEEPPAGQAASAETKDGAPERSDG